nr:hypothetical protein GCM10020185_47300 [Pseudomonas brassicacearum subsp. brassicacearum]
MWSVCSVGLTAPGARSLSTAKKTGAVIVDEGQQAEAYEDARSMLQGGFLPLLSLRFDFHA